IKERLVNDMEQLAREADENSDNEVYDFPAVAQRIRSARDEWKNVNVREKGESPELWQRFDDACSSAYRHCQHYFDQQHQLKDQSLAQRRSTCEGLEAYAERIPSQVDAGTMDWKALELVIRTAESDWQTMGEIHVKERKAINKRFRSAMNALRKFADGERLSNLEEKQTLIGRAQGIVNELQEAQLELPDAIEKIKQLQVKWKEIGPAKGEGALWKAFRQHCDEIFNQRAIASQAHKEALSTHLAAKQALNQQILALAELEGEALRHARAEFEKIKQAWHDAGSVASKNSGAANKAFESACKQYEQQDRRRIIQDKKQKWDALSHRAQLCTQLEHALEHGTPEKGTPELQTYQTQWDALAEERCIAQAEIQQRFIAVQALAQSGQADNESVIQQRLQKGLEDRLQLCLELEILAGIDSPAEYTQTRMAYQVNMLADKMKQSDDQLKREELLTLQQQWYTTHSAPQSHSANLEARYQCCIQHLGDKVEQALVESIDG
ncbi:DUF349 domain-containing protein, partial [Pseudomonadota bacterium]